MFLAYQAGLKKELNGVLLLQFFQASQKGLLQLRQVEKKGQEEFQLLIKTVMAKSKADTAVLISRIKGEINQKGEITDDKTIDNFNNFIEAFNSLTK